VTYCWATRLLRGTPGYLATNAIYFLSAALCAYNLYKGITTDPGYVPKSVSDSEIKMVSYLPWYSMGAADE
jgi:palmitoyltransferase